MKFVEYYSSDPEKRKMKRDNTAEVVELRKKVESLEQGKVDSSTVDKLVEEKLRAFLPPGLMEGLAAWNAKGQQGPIHLPSFTGSNSSSVSQTVNATTTTTVTSSAAASLYGQAVTFTATVSAVAPVCEPSTPTTIV
jgi:hypothetical protein